MSTRLYPFVVVSLWLVAMSWLMLAKVLPALNGGQPPDAQRVLPRAGEPPVVEAWRISWSDQAFAGAAYHEAANEEVVVAARQRIGWIVSRTTRREDLSADVRTLVHFDSLPLDELLGEFLGPLSRLTSPLTGSLGSKLRLDLGSRAQLDLDGRLQRFYTTVDFENVEGIAHIEGIITGGTKLDVTVSTRTDDSPEGELRYREVLHKTLDLPRDALVSDSFSPQSRLVGLRPGQSWTYPVYRAFPPNSPVQILEAKAEYFELIYWNGEPVETMRVTFQNDSGSDLSVAKEPLGRLWVRSDGTVLVQELKVGNRWVRFERYSEDRIPEAARARMRQW